jgi:hypothetical protein
LHANDEDGLEALFDRADRLHEQISTCQLELFRVIASIDRNQGWVRYGARDMAHWLWMRYGISDWKARRWIDASHALESLPAISGAFASGDLGIDKVVELTRFATPENERGLLDWATRVSPGAIRHRADVLAKRSADQELHAATHRSLYWSFDDDGRRFSLHADLPAAQGGVVVRALDRVASELPVLPGEELRADARLADALVATCSARLSVDADADRATIVVHATVDSLASADGACAMEGGGMIPAETARRLACSARVQALLEDASGDPLRLGRMAREPSAAMMRVLRHRDRECTFPGCGMRRFLQAHHVVWWSRGGPTDVDKLTLICSFHHTLVHEHGWSLARGADGVVTWFRPDGTRYRAGPGPPPRGIGRLPVHSAMHQRGQLAKRVVDFGIQGEAVRGHA